MTTRYRIAFNRMALRAKLPKGDWRWKEFTEGFDNLSLDTTEIADQIYKGYAFSPWVDGSRSNENFILAQHIAVDMDTEDERSTLDALEAHPWVRMYGGLLYTTPSHTEQSPRARILFLLDTAIEDIDGYKEALRFVTSQFVGADPACVDSARFLYGSYGCDLRIPGGVLPVGVLRRYYSRWQAKQPKGRVTPVTTGVTQVTAGENVISLDAVRQAKRAAALAENMPDELTKLREALAKIDPWSIDYNKWFGVIAAVRDEFGDAAFSLVETWAQGTPGEVRREWDRQKSGTKTKRMNIGTVYYLAAGRR